ncbi:hypothetical protein BOSEA31B_20780 [Hyphomicrobiales bacterium]|nr:hypothetical protein BOSEA31B_20780 [Hyphomicrobiales bacterium]CAH1702723.1 hypothetical protein BOSEA1005_30595 [Hyphomicrobiales bacterium]CAI0346913.1 hypothetical protein BO1005MUT1_530089 [Hyphomicrobiales bacterium]
MSRAQVVFRALFEDLTFVGRCPEGASAAVRARHEDLLARWATALDVPACELQTIADPEDWWKTPWCCWRRSTPGSVCTS